MDAVLVAAAVLAGPLAAVAVADPPAVPRAEAGATTVIVVRHAEKNPHPPGGDAGLDTRGLLRARELARVTRDSGITAVYASQFGRARLTAEPLARALGDSVRTYDANRNDLLAERIRREHAGSTVLVVGHGDSVPELIEALTGQRVAGEAVDYDRMFVVTLGSRGGFTLLRLRYGGAG
jgi:broad specificity phosphatase PhoE